MSHTRPLSVAESERKRKRPVLVQMPMDRCAHGVWGGCIACNPDAMPDCDKDMDQ